MKRTSVCLALLLSPLLGGCGESSPSAPTYAAASAAVDAGHAAWTAGRYAEAASAYSTAREMLRQPGPLEQDLILREARAWIGAGEEGAAIDLLIATTASQPQSWRATDLADFITSCLQKGPTTSQRLAETAMRIGAETLPPEELAQFDLAGFERQLAGLRSGDLTTMKELGYVDPDSEG